VHYHINHVLARHAAHLTFEHVVITFWTCSDTDKPFVRVTQRTFSTRCSSGIMAGAEKCAFCLLSTKIISWLFAKLSLRLFLCAQSVILQRSEREPTLTAGIIMYVSPAYLQSSLPSVTGCIYNIRRWTNCWALHYTGWFRSQWWHLVAVFCLVHVASKEIN